MDIEYISSIVCAVAMCTLGVSVNSLGSFWTTPCCLCCTDCYTDKKEQNVGSKMQRKC